ncbi:cdc42-interacting protein 4 isoform X2 [Protopterus annectens]|uniref:cdc42-interacting protein 4 isoform X2 n=1 Tax=Protopterus annectens TaxID=7888 RepID=UPI001CFAF804|nr:cdc42-interacting protein 4 isoform X2 [Protopterus annectens]
MDWGTDLWDQYDNIERHTQWGIDLVEKYVKFVKERTEIEQTYAKQLRNLVKKYSPKRISREDPEMKFSQYQSFLSILKELNDFAGQREVIAENMTMNICADIIKYSQEIKQERKVYLLEGRRAQQNLETSFKHLENSKRKFERDCREAEKAALHADKTDQDINATKADVEKAKQQANLRNHMAEESKNDYASQLQKYNHDQSQFYYTDMPQIFNKMQEMDERRIKRLKQGYSSFAEMERQVMPIIGKCLDGMTKAAESVNEKYDSQLVIDLHKSGFPRPGDVEFEDYSQVINRASSDSSLGTPKPAGDVRSVGKNKGKRWLFSKRYKATVSEDFSHLPPEQRRKKLQQKLDECHKDLQKEFDQRDALHKMKDVYQKNPQMGDPNSLDRGIAENKQNVDRLQTEIQKYEMWLADAEGRLANKGDTIRYSGHLEHSVTLNNNGPHEKESPDTTHSDDSGQEAITQPVYTEFEEEFPEEDEEETVSPIGECIALYPFEGSSEGTMSMTEGEKLDVVEEDKGDGWTRVRRSKGEEGYVPTTYIKITLDRH